MVKKKAMKITLASLNKSPLWVKDHLCKAVLARKSSHPVQERGMCFPSPSHSH